MNRIPVAGPWITEKEVAYAADAARTGWYDRAGDYPDRFEKAIAARHGVAHAVSLPHCTAGLHLALVALGVGPGDEVIVPELTWIATAAPIRYVGATPVFADVDPRTWCLSAETFERCVTPRTKAVIPVDLYGNLPDWAALRAAADRCGVAVIEDAAEAIGSEQAGRSAGSFGDVGVFSFHGSKTLATGEGGMLVTDRTDIADRVKFLRDHGRTPGDRMFFNAEVAFKYKMNPVTAALGLAQLERLDELVGKKREIFGWYADGFRDVPGLTLNPEPPGDRNSYWMTTLLWDDRYPASKTNVLQGLWDRGIDARPFFHPLSSLPAYRDAPSAIDAARRNPTAYSIAARGVNLPSALCLTRTDVDRVVKVVLTILTEPRRPESA